GGRVLLVAVVSLHDLDVTVFANNTGCEFQQFEAEVHPHTHVGGEDHAGVVGSGGECGLLGSVEASGANHQQLAVLRAQGSMRHGGRGGGEVDEDVEAAKFG